MDGQTANAGHGLQVDQMECYCGLPVGSGRVTRPGPDCNRRFLCCVKEIGDQSRCAYYLFVDEEQKEDAIPSCLCSLRCSMFQIKKEGPTKGRSFYSCGLPMGHPQRCEYWQLVGGPPYTPPEMSPVGVVCVCGERALRRGKQSEGINQGKLYDQCAQKKCGFFRWVGSNQ